MHLCKLQNLHSTQPKRHAIQAACIVWHNNNGHVDLASAGQHEIIRQFIALSINLLWWLCLVTAVSTFQLALADDFAIVIAFVWKHCWLLWPLALCIQRRSVRICLHTDTMKLLCLLIGHYEAHFVCCAVIKRIAFHRLVLISIELVSGI